MAHKRKHHPLYRRHHSAGGTNYKTLGLAAAAGVAAVVGLGFAATKVETLRTYWYAGPAVLAVGGVLLAKKMPTIALALVSAAGIFGYMGWMAKSEADKQATKGGEKATAGYEAGAFMARQDSGLYERNAGMLSGAGTLQGAGANRRLSSAGALQGVDVARAMRSRGAAGLAD